MVFFSVTAMQVASVAAISRQGLSPLVIGILIGMICANTLRSHLPKEWVPGILFCSKTVLRAAIIPYGFRITFQQIAMVGIQDLRVSAIVVTTTFLSGAFAGQKLLKVDPDTTTQIAAGSSVCGAAAVLATEPVPKAGAHKSVIAVGTVVLFGTTSMFPYPILFRAGSLHMSREAYALCAGGTIHEVVHVVGAATATGDDVARIAVIVKMIRVLLIAPLLIVPGLVLSALARSRGASGDTVKLVVPWFAVLFILVSGLNSFGLLPAPPVGARNTVDTFLLTMAMTAPGMETNSAKFRQAGIRPFIPALVLFAWLTVGGYFITSGIMATI